ncbi:hypothetical protein CRE_06887 [Caenorhabditis remanei]|uniref:BTB domain-containing protein n=1 Tax=Caenorhabditis remanei TaxID=31234 RepID=E3MZQ2_CAERE|nr:hypothetical protein CRE_06887 [Caenorhabditis remanei]
MWGAAIEYKSGKCNMDSNTKVLESKSHKGIKCIWTGSIYYSFSKYNFKWKFYWDELKSQGVDKLTGHITVFSVNNECTAIKMNVELTENNQEFTKEFGYDCTTYDTFYYEYSLTPHYAPIIEKPSYEKMFAPSDQNDTILIVDGKKLHVNKTFLSYHSEFFRALFSSNFKEGQMDEIPIGDVSFKDFALLLSTFYPKPVFPSDESVEMILKLARRFLVSFAVISAEHHLMNNLKINIEKMLCLADEYGMSTLLEKCIRELNTMEKAKKLKQSETYDQLSAETKLKVYERLVDSS